MLIDSEAFGRITGTVVDGNRHTATVRLDNGTIGIYRAEFILPGFHADGFAFFTETGRDEFLEDENMLR